MYPSAAQAQADAPVVEIPTTDAEVFVVPEEEELAQQPEFESPSSGSATSESSQSTSKSAYARYPLYQRVRPKWAFEAAGSWRALGGSSSRIPGLGTTSNVYAVSLQFEYQPPILQVLGVVSLGPSLTLYPIPGGAVTSGMLGLWSGGGQIRYQARYFREQPIVPMVGYSMEYVSYSFRSGATGRMLAKGPFFGGMFLLNVVEPSSAAEMFVNFEIARSYLVAEYRMLSGTDSDLSLSGSSIFVGLRLEF